MPIYRNCLPDNTSSPRVQYSVLIVLYYLCDPVHLQAVNKFLVLLSGNFFLFGKFAHFRCLFFICYSLIVSLNMCSLIYIYLLLLNWITTALLVLFMPRSPTGTLFPLDLEIEATLRRNRTKRRRKLLQDRTIVSILEEET